MSARERSIRVGPPPGALMRLAARVHRERVDAGELPRQKRRRSDPKAAEAIKLCRLERRKRARRPDPAFLEAKAAYEALLADEERARKGGRPRKGMSIKCGARDPKNALLEALG